MENQVIPVTTTEGAISHLKLFRKNWDGCNSPAIRVKVLKKLEIILHNLETNKMPLPKILPISGGSVILGWLSHHRDVELEITPNGSMEFFFNEKIYDRTGELQDENVSGGELINVDGIDYVIAWFSEGCAGEA